MHKSHFASDLYHILWLIFFINMNFALVLSMLLFVEGWKTAVEWLLNLMMMMVMESSEVLRYQFIVYKP